MNIDIIKITVIPVFLVSIFKAVNLLWGEKINKRYAVYSKEMIEAKIVELSSKKTAFKIDEGNDHNEYWSIIAYNYMGQAVTKKIIRSKLDFVGRNVQIYRTNYELDLRVADERPYLYVDNGLMLVFPVLILIVGLLFFTM